MNREELIEFGLKAFQLLGVEREKRQQGNIPTQMLNKELKARKLSFFVKNLSKENEKNVWVIERTD